MLEPIISERLSLSPLQISDAEFIRQLVNTEGWLRFIGNRNVNNEEDAKNYINKILNARDITYYIARLKDADTAIGIVTFIKRDYLEHYDIGFAFLPSFSKLGYAFEGTLAVLKDILKTGNHSEILATTLPENVKSIRLLEKLNFSFQKQIINNGEKLLVYEFNCLHRII